MSSLNTGKFGLPYLAVSQAQKETTHNEALARIDALLHPVVEGVLSIPPEPDGEEDAGKCWLIAEDAAGIWIDKDGQIAAWTGSGWRYLRPVEAMRIFNQADQTQKTWRDGEWLGAPAISSPGGGSVIDSEARAALAALLEYLRDTGVVTA